MVRRCCYVNFTKRGWMRNEDEVGILEASPHRLLAGQILQSQYGIYGFQFIYNCLGRQASDISHYNNMDCNIVISFYQAKHSDNASIHKKV
jgi:hypothetical protein